MTQHKFTTSAAAHACGIEALLRTRIEEVTARTHQPPRFLVLHEPTIRALIVEMGGVPLPDDFEMKAGGFDGVPLMMCPCKTPMAADWLIDSNGDKEEI